VKRIRVWRDGHEVDPPKSKQGKKLIIDPLATRIKHERRNLQRAKRNTEKALNREEPYTVPGRNRATFISGGLPSLGKKS